MTNEDRELAQTFFNGVFAITKNIIHLFTGKHTRQDIADVNNFKKEAISLKQAQNKEYKETIKEFKESPHTKSEYRDEMKKAIEDRNLTRTKAIGDSYKKENGA